MYKIKKKTINEMKQSSFNEASQMEMETSIEIGNTADGNDLENNLVKQNSNWDIEPGRNILNEIIVIK